VPASQLSRPAPSPVPANILEDTETVSAGLEGLVRRYPDYECLTILDRRWQEHRTTLAEFWHRAKAVQHSVQEGGLAPGDAAVLVFPTGVELIAGYFGVMLAGGVPAVLATPSNRMADADVYRRHVGDILRNAGASVLYCEDAVADLFGEAAEADDVLGASRLMRPRDVIAPDVEPPTVPVIPSDFATIQYSSGSTGTPKGVLFCQRAMLNHIRSVREGLGITPDDVSVNWIPLYHDMGLIDAFLLPLLSGCPTVLIPTMDFLREPSLWLWAIHGYRGTLSWAPNMGYSLCSKRIKDDAIEGLDLSSWRLAMSAAEPVLEETVHAFADRFRPYGLRETTMTPAWGLAESGTIVTTHAPDEPTRIELLDREALVVDGVARPVAPGASNAMPSVGVGRGLPRARVEIRDEERTPLADRYLGEIWIETDCLFTAYKEDPELTAQTLVDGWFDTGDQGYLSDGHLFFVSRSKDLIVIGGEKYAPHDVETAIGLVPGVRDGCAVAFGVMNEVHGTEELGAVVETKEEDPAALAALADAIRAEVDRIIGLGVRHLHLVPPGGVNKTSSGKLARRATRARYPEVFGPR
jgi:acyl-CoA synthetase (AMP-forming)/AMP-acid ligase II